MSTQVQTAYGTWASTYDEDRNLTRDLDEQVTRTALHGLHCKSILEFGGTGKNTALLSQIGESVRALDFSQEMVEKAKAKVPTENVVFEMANITQPWPCADNSIDLVVCNLVLEHVENILFVFSEAARVLINGGKLFVSELHPFRQYEGVQAHFKRDGETIEIAAFVHHISDFLEAAAESNLALLKMSESWHAEDEKETPRLVTFRFVK
jgi:ubiquinone/menaquinone biosynthesis C-methylase UbiE